MEPSVTALTPQEQVHYDALIDVINACARELGHQAAANMLLNGLAEIGVQVSWRVVMPGLLTFTTLALQHVTEEMGTPTQ